MIAESPHFTGAAAFARTVPWRVKHSFKCSAYGTHNQAWCAGESQPLL